MLRPKVTTPAEVIKAIANGAKGPRVIAAIDFDGVLVGGSSGSVLRRDRAKRKELTLAELAQTVGIAFKSMSKVIEANELFARSVSRWAGKTEHEMEEMGGRLYEDQLQDSVYPEMRQLIAAHRQAGHTIVVATAASRYQVEPTVKSLGIDYLLCTEVEVVAGQLTGKVFGDALSGSDKAAAIGRFVSAHEGSLAQTHFYAHGDEELGLMTAVGHPHPVNPGKQLAEASRVRGWPILRLDSRGGATPENFVRGIAGLASILPILQVGMVTGLLGRDKRKSANLIMPAWIGTQLKLAGVELRVTGRENLTIRRPAVFVFNHRNNYDASFVAALVKSDYVTIAKKEMAENPVGKLVAALSHTIFIDRDGGDADKTADVLQQITDAVAQGYSIIVAPEGTRVRGKADSVGRFKLGAFYMAMTANVPVIPVVIRNALDVASRDGPMRPGVVEVAVLPPVSIDASEPRKLAAKAKEVRQMFVDTLANWA
ncbi:MAG: HAD-IB family hydrolase [Novosphingobium sp.]